MSTINSRRRGRRRWGWAGCVAAVVILLVLGRPWVVVPLHGQGTEPAHADLVDAAWQRLLDGITSARPMADVGDQPTLVQVRGILVEVNTVSMNGWAQVQLLSASGAGIGQARLQLGPVVHGSALRDAAGLTYDDFDTQVDYARAASALNARAMQHVDRERLGTWTGQVIVLTGVASAAPASGAAIEVVPLQMALETVP